MRPVTTASFWDGTTEGMRITVNILNLEMDITQLKYLIFAWRGPFSFSLNTGWYFLQSFGHGPLDWSFIWTNTCLLCCPAFARSFDWAFALGLLHFGSAQSGNTLVCWTFAFQVLPDTRQFSLGCRRFQRCTTLFLLSNELLQSLGELSM